MPSNTGYFQERQIFFELRARDFFPSECGGDLSATCVYHTNQTLRHLITFQMKSPSTSRNSRTQMPDR